MELTATDIWAVPALAETGIDVISIGAFPHPASALDVSLEVLR
jgi:nicotinate-nucleotide pyrophosphorylase